MSTTYRETFCIDADHPALPGHFPGRPLVPGVLLLEQVALALAHWHGQRLAKLIEAKFAAPLLPGEEAAVELSEVGARVRFAVRRGETLLARGQLEGTR